MGLSFVASPQRRVLPLRLAVGTAAVALAVAVTGPGLVASLHDLVAHPRGYGTSWDAVITGPQDPFLDADLFKEARRAVRASPDVTAAAGLNINNEGRVGRLAVPIVGVLVARRTPLGSGPSSPPVGHPRPETRSRWARRRCARSGSRSATGSRVRMSPEDIPQSLEVVGETLVNDGFTVDAGRVAVVDAQWFGAVQGRTADMIALRTSSSRSRGLDNMAVTRIPPPAGVRNLLRIDRMPTFIAWFIALLALAVVGHAITVVARTERRQLAVLRALGCTRTHLATALSSSALTIVGLGVIIGVPIGLVAEQLIWSQLERQGGFASAATASWQSGVIISAAVVLAAAIGALQGWVAGRRRPAEELHVE